MALIIKSIFKFYHHAFFTLKGAWIVIVIFYLIFKAFRSSDPRSGDKYLVQDSPLPVLSILAAYILLCKFGPVFMKSRKAFELYSVMMIYNLIQITFCTYYASQVSDLLMFKDSFDVSSKFLGRLLFIVEKQIQFRLSTRRLQHHWAWHGRNQFGIRLFSFENFRFIRYGLWIFQKWKMIKRFSPFSSLLSSRKKIRSFPFFTATITVECFLPDTLVLSGCPGVQIQW